MTSQLSGVAGTLSAKNQSYNSQQTISPKSKYTRCSVVCSCMLTQHHSILFDQELLKLQQQNKKQDTKLA